MFDKQITDNQNKKIHLGDHQSHTVGSTKDLLELKIEELQSVTHDDDKTLSTLQSELADAVHQMHQATRKSSTDSCGEANKLPRLFEELETLKLWKHSQLEVHDQLILE